LFDSWKHQFTDFSQNPETILSLKNGLQSANYVGSLSITYNADVAIVGSCDTSPTKPSTGRARGQLIAFSQQAAK
jgi:hypothetical protein